MSDFLVACLLHIVIFVQLSRRFSAKVCFFVSYPIFFYVYKFATPQALMSFINKGCIVLYCIIANHWAMFHCYMSFGVEVDNQIFNISVFAFTILDRTVFSKLFGT